MAETVIRILLTALALVRLAHARLAEAQHFHFLLPDPLALRTWYLEKFGLTATTRRPHQTPDIPGINLTFAGSKTPMDRPTKGGIIDHLGFEVQNLEALCR